MRRVTHSSRVHIHVCMHLLPLVHDLVKILLPLSIFFHKLKRQREKRLDEYTSMLVYVIVMKHEN